MEVGSTRILVICGAGASSTFVAGRLRRAAVGAGVELTASAGAVDSLGGESAAPALVLVGSHLASRQEEIAAAVAPTRVVLLPADIAKDLDGTRTLALVTNTLSLA